MMLGRSDGVLKPAVSGCPGILPTLLHDSDTPHFIRKAICMSLSSIVGCSLITNLDKRVADAPKFAQGVRFGTSEIYNVLLQHFPEIEDSLCIGRRREQDPDESVVLFVKMQAGHTLSEALKDGIRKRIRTDLSARHVPAYIDETIAIPYTLNGKKYESHERSSLKWCIMLIVE